MRRGGELLYDRGRQVSRRGWGYKKKKKQKTKSGEPFVVEETISISVRAHAVTTFSVFTPCLLFCMCFFCFPFKLFTTSKTVQQFLEGERVPEVGNIHKH